MKEEGALSVGGRQTGGTEEEAAGGTAFSYLDRMSAPGGGTLSWDGLGLLA